MEPEKLRKYFKSQSLRTEKMVDHVEYLSVGILGTDVHLNNDNRTEGNPQKPQKFFKTP